MTRTFYYEVCLSEDGLFRVRPAESFYLGDCTIEVRAYDESDAQMRVCQRLANLLSDGAEGLSHRLDSVEESLRNSLRERDY